MLKFIWFLSDLKFADSQNDVEKVLWSAALATVWVAQVFFCFFCFDSDELRLMSIESENMYNIDGEVT